MLTIILEGVDGLMLVALGIGVCFPPPHRQSDYILGLPMIAIGVGLLFLSFGRFMGWPV